MITNQLSYTPPKRREPDFDAMVLAYWLMNCRSGKQTAPGEVVDLGEIGAAPEKTWTRMTPYSLAKPGT